MVNYPDYLLSQEWHDRREAALSAADHRCQVCNSPDNLEVHHSTYERIGHELPGDLTVLCATCHGLHSKRMEQPPYYWLRRLGFDIQVPVYD